MSTESGQAHGQRRQAESAVGQMYHFGARFMLPAIGRFVSADAIVPGPNHPQSFNRYSYVRNSPLGRIDPSGNVDLPHFMFSPFDSNFDLPDRVWLMLNVDARILSLDTTQYDRSAPFGVGSYHALHAIVQLDAVGRDPATMIEVQAIANSGQSQWVDIVEPDGSFYEVKPATWKDSTKPTFGANQGSLGRRIRDLTGASAGGRTLNPGDPRPKREIDLGPYGATGRTLVIDSFGDRGVLYYSVRGRPPERLTVELLAIPVVLKKALEEFNKALNRKPPPVRVPLPQR